MPDRSRHMGGKEHCSYCYEFYKSTCGSDWGKTKVIIPGCDKCHNRHEQDVHNLEKKINSLKLEVEEKNTFYETEQSDLLATTSAKMVKLQNDYEKMMSELKLNSSLEINKLKNDNMCQRKKVQFLQARRDSLHGDVVLAVSGHQITAHRTILASRSPLFEKVVLEPVEKPTKVINIDEVTPPILEAIVDFCYSGEIAFSELVAPDEVLKVAHTFELGLLMEYCDAELCRRLTVDNVPRMLKISRKFGARELQEAAWKLFKEHFDALKSKLCEVLEGPEGSTPFSQSCPELDEKWNVNKDFGLNST